MSDNLPGEQTVLGLWAGTDVMNDHWATRQYFSSNDESDDSGGEPLDANYDTSDLDEKSEASMREEAQRFYDLNETDIESWPGPGGSVRAHNQAGHDFWLTRNGHGAGFSSGGAAGAQETNTRDNAIRQLATNHTILSFIFFPLRFLVCSLTYHSNFCSLTYHSN